MVSWYIHIISLLNSNLANIVYGAADLIYSNATMMTCMLSAGKGVQLPMYSSKNNFETGIVCPICYIAVLGIDQGAGSK